MQKQSKNWPGVQYPLKFCKLIGEEYLQQTQGCILPQHFRTMAELANFPFLQLMAPWPLSCILNILWLYKHFFWKRCLFVEVKTDSIQWAHSPKPILGWSVTPRFEMLTESGVITLILLLKSVRWRNKDTTSRDNSPSIMDHKFWGFLLTHTNYWSFERQPPTPEPSVNRSN